MSASQSSESISNSSEMVIQKKSVTFKNGLISVAADIYFPPLFNESSSVKYAAIVCAHPIGGCKEQTSGKVYGTKLAENGFITLAFDAAYQGASGGQPHWLEDAATRVEDFRCAVDYLVTLKYVNDNRIGILAICGGGGYSVTATMTDRRVKALGLVSAVNGGRMFRQFHSSDEAMLAALEAMGKQRTAEARGAAVKATDLLPATPEAAAAAAFGVADTDLVEATRYYKTPIGQAAHGNSTLVDSRLAANYVYDAFLFAEVFLTQPLQIIVGAIPGAYGSYRDGHELYHRAKSAKKNLFVVKAAQHFDLYWKPDTVAVAMEKLIPFYNENL